MRPLAVTLQYRHYGRAMVSHAKAAENYPGVLDWLHLYNHDAPDGTDRLDIIVEKYRRARELFLSSTADTFISIEDDVVIPLDTFQRFEAALEDGADVVYGLICWRSALGGGGWSAYLEMEGDTGSSILTDLERARKAYEAAQPIDVVGVHLGCTAIRREVLEQIDFRRHTRHANDWSFALDTEAAGYRQVCDMGLRCGHIALTPTPRVIWPSIENEQYQRIEYIG